MLFCLHVFVSGYFGVYKISVTLWEQELLLRLPASQLAADVQTPQMVFPGSPPLPPAHLRPLRLLATSSWTCSAALKKKRGGAHKREEQDETLNVMFTPARHTELMTTSFKLNTKPGDSKLSKAVFSSVSWNCWDVLRWRHMLSSYIQRTLKSRGSRVYEKQQLISALFILLLTDWLENRFTHPHTKDIRTKATLFLYVQVYQS